MILRKSVKNLLACHPYTNGKIGLPRPKYDRFTNYKICDGKYSIELIDAVRRESVKKFMLDEFYSTAPVPVALQLYKSKEGEKRISNFLLDELSLFLDCGVSFAIYHQSQVIGIGINLLFERPEENANAEYIPAEAWHNAAADIASEGSPGDTVHCWRHYQFLHLQHFCQNITRKFNAKFCLHLSCIALAKEFRGKDNITHNMILRTMKEVFSMGGVCTTVSNFPGFERHLYSSFPEQTTLEDRVKYEDIELTLDDGVKPLRSLAHLGEIKYFSLHDHSFKNQCNFY